MIHPSRFDVCVVGGGPAGAASAALLSRQGLAVVLIAAPSARSSSCEVLSPDTLRQMKALHVDAAIGQENSSCRGILARWASIAPEFHDYELWNCQPGLIVDRAQLDAGMQCVAGIAGTTLIRQGRIHLEHRRDGEWRVTLKGGGGPGIVEAGLLVDATGRSGRVVSGAFLRLNADRLVCLWTRHEAPLADPSLLLLDRSAHGWWYSVSASRGCTDVAFFTDSDCVPSARHRCAFLQSEYRQADLLRSQLQQAPSFEQARARDARTGRRKSVAGDDWVAIGDAALSIDPLSGAGIGLALEGAARAAGAVTGRSGDKGQGRFEDYSRWCDDQFLKARHLRAKNYGNVWRELDENAFWSRRQPTVAAPAIAFKGASHRGRHTASGQSPPDCQLQLTTDGGRRSIWYKQPYTRDPG